MNSDRRTEPAGAYFFFIILGPNMSSNFIKIYMDRFYTQRSFHRVQEHPKRSLDKKVMIVRSWRPCTNSAAGQLRETHEIAFPVLF